MTKSKLAKMIDHTILKPEATMIEVIKVCEEAIKYEFASVCINPSRVSLAKEILEGSGVKVCTVIGFPLGASTINIKKLEAEEAINDGATEIDMVINIGKLKDGDIDYVLSEINEVTRACQDKAIVKVIIETCLLTEEEKITVCKLAKEAGASFVKTSTGFSNGGATLEDIKLMRKIVGKDMGVKASGGIKTKSYAKELIKGGATRIGASSSVSMIEE